MVQRFQRNPKWMGWSADGKQMDKDVMLMGSKRDMDGIPMRNQLNLMIKVTK